MGVGIYKGITVTMNLKNFILLLIIVLATSCRPSTSLSDKGRKAISDTVRQTLNNYYADIKKEGLSAELHYLDSSSEFFWVPPGYSSSLSFDSVSSILKKNAPLYKSINNTWETLQVNSLTPELANY